ncbi:hypothetical protein DPMN_015995, partial [Dreissena polymorpha]
RCFDRLRANREKLRDRFRKLPSVSNNELSIEDLMKQEWAAMRREHEEYLLDIEKDDAFDSVDIDHVLDLFNDIQQELQQEEIRLIEEYACYERGTLQLEEQSLCSAIDKLSTVEVICPMCKKSPLRANKSVIFCGCGLRIDTEQDCLTLSNVKHMLETGLGQHITQCECEPVYSVVAEGGTTNLLMTCPDCDWMSIVI